MVVVGMSTDACLVVDALEPSVREELVKNFCDRELISYQQIFEGAELAKLDKTERRYAWVKRRLRKNEEIWKIFPSSWHVDYMPCIQFNKLTSRHPTLKWAQRDDLVYITIDLPDAKNVNLKLTPEGKFYFSATSGPDSTPYEIDINLYDNVNVDESKANVGSRNVVYIVKKEESKWWNRLLKQEGRTPAFVKVDWNKWVDEDEQDEKAGPDMDYDDVNFSSLNLGGGGGEDFDADDDDDDEE